MQTLKIHLLADIIIVDGGSTDDSLEKECLKSKDVYGLITKEGPGRLSAQLRCAYAFSFEQNYDGVATIDGNNKDDPKYIPSFIEKLKDGTDFVQVSRYQEGGQEENIPIIRSLAIKLIHAPLLSLSSGFKWSDTSQGFRAYSSKLLESERLKIFRKVFSNYELLSFLNHAAPKSGFRCLEIGCSLPPIRHHFLI